MRPWRGSALLFDLFGTVVHFAPQVPTVEVAGTPWRSTMGWLREAAERQLPNLPFDDLLATLMHVTEEIVRQRPPEYREVPSRERFRRALLKLGVNPHQAPSVAAELSQAHMEHLAAVTLLPSGCADLLGVLASRYRLALVSNFDHAPTARRILAEHGLTAHFEVVLISDEFGRRKPHPAIFDAALAAVNATPGEALVIGDSIPDDIVGAHRAGVPAVWINAKREPLRPGVPAPDYTIAQLDELRGIVELG